MLTLDVLPDPARVAGEMRRITRRGGTVAGLVNDFRCGHTPFEARRLHLESGRVSV